MSDFAVGDSPFREWTPPPHSICRIAVIYAIGAIAHFKYYFAWSVSESAMIFSGFCFNGWDSRGRARWDRYFNTSIRGVELQTSAAQLATYWNTCTGSFLRYCKAPWILAIKGFLQRTLVEGFQSRFHGLLKMGILGAPG